MGASSLVPEWYDEFEARLDEMLGLLRPEWRLSREPPAYAVPIVAAVGYRSVHEGIIERLEHGTFIEQIGATRAWYQAQPGLHYLSSDDYYRGEPAPDSVLRYREWQELLPRYREAGRRAVARCGDPERRACLSELTANSSEIVSIGTPPDE